MVLSTRSASGGERETDSQQKRPYVPPARAGRGDSGEATETGRGEGHSGTLWNGGMARALSSPPPRATCEAPELSRPGTQGARRGARCHYHFRHHQYATLSGEERHLTNVSTNVLKDTLTDNKSQRSFRPLAAAKVWKRGLGGDRKALQEPELIWVHSGSWSSGYLCVWRQERG